jgi:hypothetical protein
MEQKDEDQSLAAQPTRSAGTRSVARSTGSYGGQDGYCAFQEEEQRSSSGVPAAGDDGAADGQDAFVVGWDGEHDALDPRGASAARKWAVVLVVAGCSLCV